MAVAASRPPPAPVVHGGIGEAPSFYVRNGNSNSNGHGNGSASSSSSSSAINRLIDRIRTHSPTPASTPSTFNDVQQTGLVRISSTRSNASSVSSTYSGVNRVTMPMEYGSGSGGVLEGIRGASGNNGPKGRARRERRKTDDPTSSRNQYAGGIGEAYTYLPISVSSPAVVVLIREPTLFSKF